MTKTITDNQLLGDEGVNLVQKRVLEMRFTWHPSNQPLEAGLDGFVELRDSNTGEVKNSWIGVQSKATNDLQLVDGCPSYSCKAKDLDYWLGGTMPVVLVYSKPSMGVAYWVSVKDYFRKQDPKKNRTIRFDPSDDLLTASSADDWKALSQRYGAGTYFAPPAIMETLSSNLIEVEIKADTIYAAETELTDPSGFRESLKKIDPYPPFEWAVGPDGLVHSFHDLTQPPWSDVIRRGTVRRVSSRDLSLSDHHEIRSIFVRLLNGCFRSILKGWRIRYSRGCDCNWFAAEKGKVQRELVYKSRSRTARRDVVKMYKDKAGDEKVLSYRHNAFEKRFMRLGEQWYLLIEPTYIFTSDGDERHKYHESLLEGIQQREGDAAVSGTVVMIRDMLRDRDTMFEKPNDFIGIGELATVECSVGIDDEAWRRAKVKSLPQAEEVKRVENPDFGRGLF